MDTILNYIIPLQNLLWGYIIIPVMIIFGIYLSFYFNWIQFSKLPETLLYFLHCFKSLGKTSKSDRRFGLHPLQTFFASLGSCVGIGNIVGICTAIQIGGPGAAFWMWFSSLIGMVIKYAEVYLGVKYRVLNKQGGYDGGPAYYIAQITACKWIPRIAALLLCIYGVDIYIFDIVKDTLTINYSLDPLIVSLLLLALVLIGGAGGVKRVTTISSWIIPIFIVFFNAVLIIALFSHWKLIPQAFFSIFSSAFTSQAASGAFIGSSISLSMSQGFSRGCYAADVGVGYAAVIQSEAKSSQPNKQASLAMFGIFLDTFIICTLSVLLILVTDFWKEPIHEVLILQTTIKPYFPYAHIVMPVFLFLLGYSALIVSLYVGLKNAVYLSPKYGTVFYYLYAVGAFLFFSFREANQAIAFITTCGGALLLINLWAIFKLRKEICLLTEE